MRTTARGALAAVLLGATLTAAAAPPTPAGFEKLRAAVKPAPGEDRWDRIPWMTGLWEARQKAAAEGKPILLWEMDGHPLTCT